MISLIAAIGKNNELGKGNDLLWKQPADMKHFKEITMLHPVVMGRKTFESIGHPLSNRRNVVITRDVNYKKEGVEIVHSLSEVLDLFPDPNEEIFVIGGAEIYRETMSIADKLYITHVEAGDAGADTFFPKINLWEWKEISHEERAPDEKNIFPYTFSLYKKIKM